MTEEFKCQCALCIDRRKFFSIIEKLSDEDKKWMESFYEDVDNERLDADVNGAILDGTWPSAIDRLEWSLKKAREYNNNNEHYTGETTRSV